MKIRIQRRGLHPTETIEEVQSAVITDNYGNPLYIAQQLEEGTIIAEKAGSIGFDKLLKALGIGLNTTYKVSKL